MQGLSSGIVVASLAGYSRTWTVTRQPTSERENLSEGSEPQDSLEQIAAGKQDACPISGQTRPEELLNSLTHGAGLVFSVIALVTLVISTASSGDQGMFVGCSVFGTSLVLLYGASTLYHATRSLAHKRILQVVDHACVYGLIAGTYTPFTLVTLEGTWGWSLFAVVWSMCAIGVVMKIFFIGRFELFSTFIYLAMGWLIVVAIGPLWENLASGGFALLVAGGVSYTAGTVFFTLDRKNHYFHAVWHLFVLGGSVCHYLAVFFYLARPTG